MKYKIEKNTVQETLILPLYSRKLCTEPVSEPYREIASPLLRLVFLAISLVGTIQHTSFCTHNCIA